MALQLLKKKEKSRIALGLSNDVELDYLENLRFNIKSKILNSKLFSLVDSNPGD